MHGIIIYLLQNRATNLSNANSCIAIKYLMPCQPHIVLQHK